MKTNTYLVKIQIIHPAFCKTSWLTLILLKASNSFNEKTKWEKNVGDVIQYWKRKIFMLSKLFRRTAQGDIDWNGHKKYKSTVVLLLKLCTEYSQAKLSCTSAGSYLSKVCLGFWFLLMEEQKEILDGKKKKKMWRGFSLKDRMIAIQDKPEWL